MHSYANDTQLYLAFSPNVQVDDASAVKAICDGIMDLDTRPSFFDYWKGSHEILFFRSCTCICGQVLDVLLPIITYMINMSYESGLFAEEWRQALVLPTLKRCGFDIGYKNFRPVSNLPYVFKLSERAAADQLLDHVTINGLHPELQSSHSRLTYNLRSSGGILLASSTFITKVTLGDRSFQVAAPKLWNALPCELRDIPNLHTFKSNLKTHLFKFAYR